nr:hypothetical protein Iba_chr05dCG4990 [Ipomoea batatas]
MVGWWLWLYIMTPWLESLQPQWLITAPGRGIGFRQLLEVLEDWRLDCWRIGGWTAGGLEVGCLDLCCCLLTWKSGIVNE